MTSVMWPEGGLEAVQQCPVCGTQERELLHADLTDRIFGAPGTWTLLRCKECHCAFLDPRPTPDTIHLAYEKYYTHPSSKEQKNTGAVGRVRGLITALTNGYCNWRYGTSFQPALQLGVHAIKLAFGKRKALERQFRQLPHSTQGATLLDVGFGDGKFLDLAVSAGWNVFGCETDPVSITAAQSRGLSVRQGSIEAFNDMPESFDVITMSHVVEHVHDPKELCKKVYRLLKPGGGLWIETPNLNSYGHAHFAQNWRGLEPPRHLVLFTWKALEKLLREVGFSETHRYARHDVYARLASKSAAIARGQDPYTYRPKSLVARVFGFFVMLLTFVFPQKSEFITLVAKKPFGGTSQGKSL